MYREPVTDDGRAAPRLSLLRSRRVLAPVATVLLTVFLGVVGVFEVPIGWSVAKVVVLAPIGYFAGRAIWTKDHEVANHSLWTTVALLAVLATGTIWYSSTRNDDQAPLSHEFIVDLESEIQMLRPSAEPGGPQLIFLPPLEGQQSYWFVCTVTLSDGSAWFRLAGEPTSFVHGAFLRRPNGMEPVTLPDC